MSVSSNYLITQPKNGALGSYSLSQLPAVTTAIPDGVNTLVFTQILPFGCYSGSFETVFTGGATTDIARFTVLILTADGTIVVRSQVLTDVTLPDANQNYISVPINFNVNTPTATTLSFYLFADYTGTAISVPANLGFLRLTKIL